MGLRIIQISDCHLFADPGKTLLGVNTQDSFQAVRDKVRAEENGIKLILLTGDLSQDHSEAAYLRLAEMMKPLRAPAYYVPGNHDDQALMARIFPRDNILTDKQLIIDNWQIILLNSQKPGAVEGLLDASQLKYMQDCLQAYPEHHAIIVFHHPPFHVGSEWLDNLCLSNSEEFWQIAPQYPNVRMVLLGHVHQEHKSTMFNIDCYSTPSTCFQFMPHQKNFMLENRPPGYRWLDLQDDGRIETGIKRVAKYVGTFDENAKGY